MGMNDWVVDELEWDDSRKFDRGKVLDFEALEKMEEKFGRYHDVDGDGVVTELIQELIQAKGHILQEELPMMSTLDILRMVK